MSDSAHGKDASGGKAPGGGARSDGAPDEGVPRRISKPKDIEKLWRKGEEHWRYDSDGGGERDFIDRRRSAPRKHQVARPGNERDALVVQTGGPLVVLQDGDEDFRARHRRSTTTENEDATLVAIGDRVRYLYAADGDASITHVYRRRSVLQRPTVMARGHAQVLVANIDLVVVVAAATRELLRTGLIDRYLVAIAMGGLSPLVCINKMDLADEEDLPLVDEIIAMYRDAGYTVIPTSCVTGEGLGEMANALRDRLSAFSGHSGVGKTSLLNLLVPDAGEKIQDMSEQSRRGVHTTTKSTLFELPGSGYIADTPGIREFGLVSFDPNDLHTYYPEFIRFSDQCRFPFCTHTHEPDCAVQQALETGGVHPMRYRNYLQILESEGAAQ
jgi:ribosome biogenesis GTPase / thiamine phosphate phosphatase